MELKTKRLRLVPLSIEQMALLCEGQDTLYAALGLASDPVPEEEHLRAAYREMYDNCLAHKTAYRWYTNWLIIRKDQNKAIGSIGFFGPVNEKHEVEIGYGIHPPYRNNGYATEAVKRMMEWAFSEGAYYIQAQTEPENAASEKVLAKCGFHLIGERNENSLYESEKPASAWMSVYMCLGIGVGMCFGSSYGNLSIGMCIGLGVGVAIGLALDEDDKKKRKRE